MMAVHDQTTANWQRMVFRTRVPVVTIDGPQEGRILAGATTTSARVTIPAYSTAVAFGPCPLPPGLTEAPAAGTRCLILFVGAGTGNPWIVGLTNLPPPVADGGTP